MVSRWNRGTFQNQENTLYGSECHLSWPATAFVFANDALTPKPEPSPAIDDDDDIVRPLVRMQVISLTVR